MKRLLALSLGLLLAFAAAEIMLRFTWSPPILRTTPYQAQHALYGSALIPGATGKIATTEYEHGFEHSLQGLRGERVFAREKPAGTRKRVLFIGDSFTYGLGSANEEIFVSRLAARWPDVEVANAGANGYGTREELAWLDHFGAAFKPDLTVLMFFWNDLEDIVKPQQIEFELDAAGRFRRTAPSYEGDPLALHEPVLQKPLERSGLYLRWFVKYGLRGLRYRHLGIKQRSIRNEEQKQTAWIVFERLLGLVQHRATELGSQLVVAVIPDHNQVDPQARIKNISDLNFDVQARLGVICENLGVPCIDLLEGLRDDWEKRTRQLYYYADRHLTPEGNRVVAELLAEPLAEMLRE